MKAVVVSLRAGVVCVAVGVLVGCGGDDEAPSPAAAPVVVATATAAPTPAPTAAPWHCDLPVVTEPIRFCDRQTPVFHQEIDDAITLLMRQKPELFDGNFVRSPGQYYLGVMDNLRTQGGLCANFDGEEIQVKNGNGFSEQYHVLTSWQHLRRGDSTYRATCYPAAFFTRAPRSLPQRGDCALPSSTSIACTRESPKYLGLVQEAIARLRRDRPEIFRNDHVVDTRAYYDGLVALLKGRVACAIFDGEEIALKEGNEMSEQYHVMFSWGQIRADEWAYRASCYPAAF